MRNFPWWIMFWVPYECKMMNAYEKIKQGKEIACHLTEADFDCLADASVLSSLFFFNSLVVVTWRVFFIFLFFVWAHKQATREFSLVHTFPMCWHFIRIHCYSLNKIIAPFMRMFLFTYSFDQKMNASQKICRSLFLFFCVYKWLDCSLVLALWELFGFFQFQRVYFTLETTEGHLS